MKMPAGKLILIKESFGGMFIDTSQGGPQFLRPEEYEAKQKELIKAEKEGKRVKFFDPTERGFPLLDNASSSLSAIFLELTKRCNGICRHCFVDSNSPKWSSDELSFPEIEDIVREFSDIGGSYIRLTGGEPTIREDFFDIVDVINSEGITIGLNTNGLYGENHLEKILIKGIKDIRVSLDGPEEVNDSIRGEDTYRRITQTIHNISQYNRTASEPVQLTINIVLMKSNMDHIEEMINLAQSYDSLISFGLLRLTGKAQMEEMLSPEEIVASAFKAQQVRDKLKLPRGKVRINYDILCEDVSDKGFAPYPFDNSKCPLGSTGITIDAYGRIVPCGYLVNIDNDRWVGEDVRGRDLLDLWYNSKVLNEVRQIKRPGCKDCEYLVVKCNGGCPMMAYVFEGNMDGRDPYCVRDVNLIEIQKELSR